MTTQGQAADRTAAQLLTDLATVSDAVLSGAWSTGELAALPAPADLGPLISSANPLATLNSAGVGMLTPHVSFLAEPLERFRGDSGAVSTSAQGMATAAADIHLLADALRQARTTETSGWTGTAADEHRATSAQIADGVTAIAEAAKTIAGAITGAGAEVVKTLVRIVALIGEAVAKMIPVMADGIARAPLTMGASIAEAIAKCVAIANESGARIAAVMANLLGNAMNLMKLVEMVLTIVHAVAQLVQKLAKASGGDSAATKGTPSKAVGSAAAAPTAPEADTPRTGGAGGGSVPSTSRPAEPAGGPPSLPSGTDPAASLPAGARSGAVAPLHPTLGPPQGTGPSLGTAGANPFGGMAPMSGAVAGPGASNTGTSGVRPPGRQAPGGSMFAVPPKEMTAGRALAADDQSPRGGSFPPMGMPAAGQGRGEDDAEHQRRYDITADSDTFAADEVIVEYGVIGAPEPPEDGR